MEIREATEKDILEIVEVLKASLGEGDLLLSEEVWRYKHLDNPFGKSIVLLALENGHIIGVRAFMRWKWQKEEKLYSALRAVDTATHPAHQGKGIFKRLTLKAVDLAKKEGVHFIFNTPNDKSRPGYLKMGWKVAGRIPVGIRLCFSFLKKSSKDPLVLKKAGEEDLISLCDNWNKKLKERTAFFTPKTVEYLKWRYEANPLQQYAVLTTKEVYLAAYAKKRSNLKELRIAEAITADFMPGENLKREIRELEKNLKGNMISFSPTVQKLWGVKGGFGPFLTVNALTLAPAEKAEILNIDSWNASIGDLELF